jgi:hypothetical protein
MNHLTDHDGRKTLIILNGLTAGGCAALFCRRHNMATPGTLLTFNEEALVNVVRSLQRSRHLSVITAAANGGRRQLATFSHRDRTCRLWLYHSKFDGALTGMPPQQCRTGIAGSLLPANALIGAMFVCRFVLYDHHTVGILQCVIMAHRSHDSAL